MNEKKENIKECEEFKKQLHVLVHQMSMLSKYKPTKWEIKIANELLKEFSKKCGHCKTIYKLIPKVEFPKGD